MSRALVLAGAAMVCLVGVPSVAAAYEANWKMGRVYYRGVCTACHSAEMPEPVAPSAMTMAEWKAYLAADSHAKGKDTVSKYLSTEYRASIRAGNKVADKFADIPPEHLKADIEAFVAKGAKDGDSPAGCN